MESLIIGHPGRNGSFRCDECGYVVTLAGRGHASCLPGLRRGRASRAPRFRRPRFQRADDARRSPSVDRAGALDGARASSRSPGEYLASRDGVVRVVPLAREWTRIGRSLAADVRFDDPTVSRRHALIVRQADGVRVLDDRSLNGVFVNGERVEWRMLADGDEIVVGPLPAALPRGRRHELERGSTGVARRRAAAGFPRAAAGPTAERTREPDEAGLPRTLPAPARRVHCRRDGARRSRSSPRRAAPARRPRSAR